VVSYVLVGKSTHSISLLDAVVFELFRACAFFNLELAFVEVQPIAIPIGLVLSGVA